MRIIQFNEYQYYFLPFFSNFPIRNKILIFSMISIMKSSIELKLRLRRVKVNNKIKIND